jgi:sugar lactone lactonase YvrE
VYDLLGTVGAIAPAYDDDGWMLASARGFAHLSMSGTYNALGEVAAEGTRMSDGACEPQGRIWAGTVAEDHHDGGGALFRLVRRFLLDERLVQNLFSSGTSLEAFCRTWF